MNAKDDYEKTHKKLFVNLVDYNKNLFPLIKSRRYHLLSYKVQ